ncbi:hypothetical protein EMIHUDRAFT_437392 [Emiliania huxleyi CCMP1516]|uniref:CSC1/OSCA1-like 7TM region domain-containing protein n=2 Tax=Emiliania huxleyi TaxID=2903 RepID=A0A0D3IMI3_EMIH1|nr:hypothetical protein EMIHUDRAFT_437392 [Emiliania huxleyi CCMP1516]EOD12468.1 hypothetical protein EMIHUDRAFT_437392 [Emiliania huxleyi CCMP1516]|eukprot:XP_005764897.1 hypothetical protein EMIHUDRAFT_437392 [Emiliania huxleyi CCMP1516]
MRGTILSLLVNLSVMLPVILGNVMLFVSVPLLAEKLERHTTFTGKELAVMLKLVFFQVYNSVFASLAFLFDPSIDLFARPWYTTGGALIANILFGDAIFIQVVLDWVRVGGLFSRLCLAPRAKTQLQMDRLYVDDADIYLAFRVQLAGKFIILALMFGTAIPLLYLLAAFYFWLAGWIDRYNLLRRLSPPPRTDAALTRALCLVVFPLGMALHALMACLFFSSLPAEDAAEANAAAAAAAGAASSGGAAFPGAAGEFGSGADASPPSFPPAFPPPPPPSPPTRADEWLAYKIQVGATVAVGCVIGVFYLVEFARRHGCNLRLLSARQQQVVLTVFTQTDERRAAVAVSSSTMRRGDEYLPPLTKSILLLLGLDGARTTAHHVATHVARSSSLASAKPTTPRLGRLRSRAMSTGTGGAVCVSMIPETTPRRSSSFGTAAAAPAPPAADGAAAAPDPTRSARTAAAQHLQAAAAEQLRAQQPPPPQHTSLDLRSAPSDEGGGGFGHGAV